MRTIIPVLCLGFIMTGCPADDEGGDPPSPADAVADELIEALGGQETFDGLAGFRLQATGSRFIPHEGVNPDDPPIQANTFQRTIAFDLVNDALRVDTAREVLFLFLGMSSYVDIIRGDLGTTTQGFPGGPPLVNLSSDKVASIRMQEMLMNPHALVARFAPAGFESGGDAPLEGVLHHRLIAMGSPRPLTLFVNADTGQLTKVATTEHDFYLRDVTLEVEYTNWQTTATGVAYPGTVELIRDGDVLISQQVSGFETNPAFAAGTFDFPTDATPMLDAELFARGTMVSQWYYLLDSIGLPFFGVDTGITPVEVVEGVQQLQGGSHHSFVVEQEEGLVLVDAPLHEDRGDALIAYLDDEFDGKPITHVVASHFHEDHTSGIRQVLGATDAVLVVHESVVDLWEELLTRPSTISPDALASAPREVEIVTVPDDGDLTLEDATHPVTFYDMNSGHANDLIMAYEPSSNTVFVVDIYSPGFEAQFAAPDLDTTIVDNDIPTDELNILGGHGGLMHTYDDLQGFLD